MSDDAQSAAARPAFVAVVATLFPDIFPGPLGASLIGRALKDEIWRLKTLDFRDFASDKHRSVDAPPFGGGPGLVMRPDIVAAAIDQAATLIARTSGVGATGDGATGDGATGGAAAAPVLVMSPRGRPFDQARARALAAGPGVTLVCGRFEGVDERVLEARGAEEISVCDAVLMGGDVAAMVVLEATVRLLPGVVGAAESLEDESFAGGLLEHPHYTRPSLWEGREAPAVLRSGDHARIAAWRRAESARLTQARRPDLWRNYIGQRAEHRAPSAGGNDDDGETK